MTSPLYDQDFYAWANRQADLLRAGNFAAADMAQIAEEIESMGRSEQRELESRLTILLLHLLKWQFQPGYRGNSWRYSILEQRRKIERHLRHNPSLHGKLPETFADAYGDAIIEAARETGLALTSFRDQCPWDFAQVMEDGFWPE